MRALRGPGREVQERLLHHGLGSQVDSTEVLCEHGPRYVEQFSGADPLADVGCSRDGAELSHGHVATKLAASIEKVAGALINHSSKGTASPMKIPVWARN